MLREAVMSAAGRADVRSAVARVYADLQTEIDRRKPKCDASGRCCRFDQYGHRLYVTTMELAAFVGGLKPHGHQKARQAPQLGASHAPPLSPAFSPESRQEGAGGGCPFQVGGLCSVHAIRPFGCRVFFCDSTSDDWQHAQYEQFHATLKALHDKLDVPYRYVEWREALRSLGLSDPLEPPAKARQDGPRRLSLGQLPL